MLKSRERKINNRKVISREITVAEIEKLYQDQAGINKLVGFIMGDHEFIPAMMELLTDLPAVEIRQLSAGDYEQILDDLREVNADFFAIWREKELPLMLKMMEEQSKK